MQRIFKRSISLTKQLRQKPSDSAPLQDTIPGFREAGKIPTNYEIAAGLERHEFLEKLKGRDPWEDLHPIKITKLGTKKEPVHVTGWDIERYIGCSGFPADSHAPRWLTLRDMGPDHVNRCDICGNVFKYTQIHDEHDDHH